MPVPVEVSQVRRRAGEPNQIEGLGGIWRDRPWYMSTLWLLWEIERPEDSRSWNFYVQVSGKQVPVIVSVTNGHKRLTTAEGVEALWNLPEWSLGALG